ncbi:MAG TPA: hypothetical protein VF920_13305 [Dongiaceae bacterium]
MQGVSQELEGWECIRPSNPDLAIGKCYFGVIWSANSLIEIKAEAIINK